MPILVATLGRMLGYPLKLVPAKAHMYVRWEDGTDSFNIESTADGLVSHPDEYYRGWPFKISDGEMESGYYLNPLTSHGELAVYYESAGLHCLAINEPIGALKHFRVAAALCPSHLETGQVVKSLEEYLERELSTSCDRSISSTNEAMRILSIQEEVEGDARANDLARLVELDGVLSELPEVVGYRADLPGMTSEKYARRRNAAAALNKLRLTYGLPPLGGRNEIIKIFELDIQGLALERARGGEARREILRLYKDNPLELRGRLTELFQIGEGNLARMSAFYEVAAYISELDLVKDDFQRTHPGPSGEAAELEKSVEALRKRWMDDIFADFNAEKEEGTQK